MFDEVAPRYDLMNRLMTFGMDRSWRRRAVRQLRLAPGSLVLDLACGTGDLCSDLADAAHRPVGVDLSRGMLLAASRTPGPLLQGDGAALPFAGQSFDGVISGFSLRNFADQETTLAECARVLRPAGRLALLDVDQPTQPLLGAAHGLWFRTVVPRLGAIVSSAEAYRYLPRSVAYLPSATALSAMLEAVGFEGVRKTRLFFGAVQLVTATRSGTYGVASAAR